MSGTERKVAEAPKNTRPLYARVLRLKHVHPGSVLCFVYFEGSVAVGVLLAFAELITWWMALVLVLAVAVMVKLNDLIAGAVADPQPVGIDRQSSADADADADEAEPADRDADEPSVVDDRDPAVARLAVATESIRQAAQELDSLREASQRARRDPVERAPEEAQPEAAEPEPEPAEWEAEPGEHETVVLLSQVSAERDPVEVDGVPHEERDKHTPPEMPHEPPDAPDAAIVTPEPEASQDPEPEVSAEPEPEPEPEQEPEPEPEQEPGVQARQDTDGVGAETRPTT